MNTAAAPAFTHNPAATRKAKEHAGKLYPKQPKGRLYQMRKAVAAGLLMLLFATPLVRVNGQPFLLFNIFERKFILFGYPFFPQDFHLLGLAMLAFFVFIILFTVVFGRVWCGWACPQTIFMEMVFRRIEYWIEGDANAQKALDKAPWTAQKIARKTAKHFLFALLSLLIAHTAMAYLIGLDQVATIVTQPPSAHWAGFLGLLVFTAIFYLVFARLREMVCVIICPYGRLQSVLLNPETIVVAYDFLRGEPRGKVKKEKNAGKRGCSGTCLGCTGTHHTAEKLNKVTDALLTDQPLTLDHLLPKGDCVDCSLCVQVCPTGIDIRNGLQLECVNCTACIDACDGVMEKIGKPKGLIRFDSHQGISRKQPLRLTGRIVAYSAVLLVLLSITGFLVVTRNAVETTMLRVPGMLYQEQPGGKISNLYNVQVVNKTFDALDITLKLEEGMPGTIRVVGDNIVAPAGSTSEIVCFIDLPCTAVHQAKTKVTIGVYHGTKRLETVKTNFLGPLTTPGTQ